MTASIYTDVMVSNERKATISIRAITEDTYLYEITESPHSPVRGTVQTTTSAPLIVLGDVLNDYAVLTSSLHISCRIMKTQSQGEVP